MAKKALDPAKAKAAKQKKIAIGGGALLLVLLAVEVPMMMKRLHQPSAAPQDAAAATISQPGTTTPASTDPLAPPSLAGAPAAPAAPATTTTGGLPADTPTKAGLGQLAAFSRFETKDPFANSSSTTTTSPSGTPKTPTIPTPPTPPTPPSQPGGGTSSVPAPPTPAPTSAVISINGQLETVTVGANFPALQPMFQLVALTEHTAKIAISGGSYADGSATITLREKKAVTLQNTADGSRYTIVLMPQGTALPTAPGGGSTTPSAGTTATTSTGP